MAIAATGFKISSGTDLNGVFVGWSGETGNRNTTDGNGNCGWNCACNACNSNCNCNCGNCDAADIALGVVVTDYRLNIFRNTDRADGIRHDAQDQTMGQFRYVRVNCNCNCACNCACACDCDCACNCAC